MTRRIQRTGTVALGIGLITQGAGMLQNGAEIEGAALALSGILVVYGYHVIEDMDIEEVSKDIMENLEVIEQATEQDNNE